MEFERKECPHFAEQLSGNRERNAFRLRLHISGAGETPPRIKFQAAFRAATACKTMKNVDSQQHEHLKTHEYDP
jgi:hypothetical protein